MDSDPHPVDEKAGNNSNNAETFSTREDQPREEFSWSWDKLEQILQPDVIASQRLTIYHHNSVSWTSGTEIKYVENLEKGSSNSVDRQIFYLCVCVCVCVYRVKE